MSQRLFYTFLLLISLVGLSLRLTDYDRVPPFGETKDEFIYPWAGMSLLQTGIPTSWSPFVSYPTKYNLKLWDENFPMVKPYIEKPLVYPLVTGAWELLVGHKQFAHVRLFTLRLIPIGLSVVTIFLIGLFIKKLSNQKAGLLTSLLYATTPMIVLANRLSVTENLLIPLSIIALFLGVKIMKKNNPSNFVIHILGIVCGLSIMTKQVGFVVPLTMISLFFLQKNWRTLYIISLYSFIFGLMQTFITFHFGWQLYLNVTEELRRAHALGFPEAISTLFRFPGIGHKESIFLDGSMLTGWILLFSSPFWIKTVIPSVVEESHSLKFVEKIPPRAALGRDDHLLTFLLYPFLYLIFLILGEGGQTWYGWHVFPLNPFLSIIFALGLTKLWQEKDLLQFFFYFCILGSSTLRFILLFNPNWQPQWQFILGGSLIFSLVLWLSKHQRLLLVSAFIIFILVNIYTSVHLAQIYPVQIQPF